MTQMHMGILHQTTASIHQVCAQFNKKTIDSEVIFDQNTICTRNTYKSAPSAPAAPLKETPKLYVDQISDDAQAKGNKLKINAGGTDEMRMRH